jgi:hypothetical protein
MSPYASRQARAAARPGAARLSRLREKVISGWHVKDYSLITCSLRGVFRRRSRDGAGAAPAGRLYASRHSGDLGAPPPATRSGCQELAEGLRPQGVLFPRAECPKRGPGVSINAAAGRAFSVPPATVERREAWALIARRPPRLASVASAASRTRRHWMRLAALHAPSYWGRTWQSSGRFARENANGCLKFTDRHSGQGGEAAASRNPESSCSR